MLCDVHRHVAGSGGMLHQENCKGKSSGDDSEHVMRQQTKKL